MRLIELELNNFRQFQGKQKIHFFDKRENSISIILGINGEGKTGILRAVLFCLYGIKYLAQDKSDFKSRKKGEKIHLVNLNLLDKNMGTPIKAEVKLTFEHNSNVYEMKRTQTAIKYDKDTTEEEEVSDVEMIVTDESGNTYPDKITSDIGIQKVLKNIIDKNIKDFFFFDGEQIKKLSTPDEERRRKVKEGIMGLLQIDKINKSVELLEKLRGKQKVRISKQTSDTKLDALQEKEKKLEIQRDNQKNEIEILNEEIAKLTEEIEKIESQLSENKEIKELFKKRKQMNEILEVKRSALSELKSNCKKFLSQCSYNIILEESIIKTKNILSQDSIEDKYFSEIKPDILDDILDGSRRCFCDKEILKGSPEYEKLNNLRLRCKRTKLYDFVTIFKDQIGNIIGKDKEMQEELLELLKKTRSLKDEISTAKEEVEKINDLIKDHSQNEENLKQKEKNLRSFKKSESEYNSKKIEFNIKLKEIENNIAKNTEEQKSMLDKEERLKKDVRKLEYIDSLISNFKKVVNFYSNEMRNKLSLETTSMLKKLMSNEDENIIDEIEIDENYEIKAKGWDGTSILLDISSGQNELVSLSFIITLAKLASGSQEKMDLLLFMDSAFGNISGENRDNMIKYISKIASQWILLLTDTEFTKIEEEKLKKTNKIGCIYKLNQIEKGRVEIEKISDISQGIAGR